MIVQNAEYLTMRQVSELLKINRNRLYKLLAKTRNGEPDSLPAIRIDPTSRSHWRIRRDRLETWLEQRQA